MAWLDVVNEYNACRVNHYLWAERLGHEETFAEQADCGGPMFVGGRRATSW